MSTLCPFNTKINDRQTVIIVFPSPDKTWIIFPFSLFLFKSKIKEYICESLN